jgi:tellurium resistance protein TerD
MSVSLSKGGRVSLSKEAPGLKNIKIGLGWDTNATDTGTDFDLDASLFMLDANNKATADSDFIFFNNLKSTDGSVIHEGDNLTGEGDGDDEVINVDLSKVDTKYNSLAITVTIHEAEARKQNFGQVSNAFVRVLNAADGKELAKFELDEDYSSETAVLFGTLYLKNNEWRFKAEGSGFKSGLKGFCDAYGVNA